jgi:hypothetical protein
LGRTNLARLGNRERTILDEEVQPPRVQRRLDAERLAQPLAEHGRRHHGRDGNVAALDRPLHHPAQLDQLSKVV